MTTQPSITLVLSQSAITPKPGLRFWLTNAFLFVAFFLAVHDVTASRHWLQTDRRELGALKDEEEAGRSTRQIGFLLLGAVGVVLLCQRHRHAIRPRPPLMFPLSMLLIWALVSAAWSADAELTLKRQVVLVCMLLAAVGMIRQFNIAQLAEIVVVQTTLVIVVGIIVETVLGPVLPITNSEYRFGGTLHPNHMGINASLLLLGSLFIARYRNDRRFLLLSAVALATLLMTKSRTALYSAIIGTLMYAPLAYPKRRLVLGLAICVAGGAVLAVTSSGLFSDMGQTVLMNRSTSDPGTLTGRTMIWQFALDRVRDDWGRIFTGFGYGGFWTPETAAALSQRAQFSLSEGHNGYLDVMLQLGVPGIALYVCCLIATLCFSIANAGRQRPEAALAAGLLCFAMCHHLAESALTAPGFPTLIIWCVIGSAAMGCGLESFPGSIRIGVRGMT